MQDEKHDNHGGDLFGAWLKAMDWDKHGGMKQAAEGLGKTPLQVRRFKHGAKLGRDTRLAMTALAEGLKPWTEKDGGLPAVHFSISAGK